MVASRMDRLKDLLSSKTASSHNIPLQSSSIKDEEEADELTRAFVRNLPQEIKSQPLGQAMILDEQNRQEQKKEKEKEKQDIWKRFEDASNSVNQYVIRISCRV